MSLTDPAYPFQVALAAAILADAAITSLVDGRVFDAGDAQGAAYPLIEIGEDQVIPADHTAGAASQVVSTIHVWADGPAGRLAAKQICGALRDLLTNPAALAIAGHVVVSVVAEQARHLWEGEPTDPGGRVAHSIPTFRFNTRPAPP